MNSFREVALSPAIKIYPLTIDILVILSNVVILNESLSENYYFCCITSQSGVLSDTMT